MNELQTETTGQRIVRQMMEYQTVDKFPEPEALRWSERMQTWLASHIDAALAEAQRDTERLKEITNLLLDQPWHADCEIIPDYMPPFPQKDTRPTVQVRYNGGTTEYPPMLRYSAGPKQGFFWDVYGNNMQSVALAIIALSKAPAPVNVGPLIFKFPIDAAHAKAEERS